MAKLALHSDDSFVAFGRSGSALTSNDSARLFPLVQNASISVDVGGSRNRAKFIGKSTYGYNEIVKQPEVTVDLGYYLSPYGINESLFGLTGSGQGGMNVFLSNLKNYHNNIYFAFNEKEPQEGFTEPRYQTSNTWTNYNFIGIGNCYLTKYSLDFSLGKPVMASASFVGGNMVAISGSGTTMPVPSRLQNGTATAYVLPLNEMYSGLASGLPTRPEGRTGYNPSVTRPYKCAFEFSELQGGGINIATGYNPIIQNISFNVEMDRTAYYGLGSVYPMTRKMPYPLNGNVGISFLVSGIKSGDLQTLVSSETGHYIKLICRDFRDSGVYLTYEIPVARLQSASYSCDVTEVYKCQMQFMFDDFGYAANAI